MISLKALFFNGGETQAHLQTKLKALKTTSLFSPQWIDTILTADIQTNSKVDLGVVVCTLGVKSTTSMSIITN